MLALLFEEDSLQPGLVPSINFLAMTNNEFCYAGELLALSLVHGGHAANVLASWLYDILIGKTVTLDTLPDSHKWSSLLDQV